MSRRGPESVKIVIINTQYIETDSMSFKSVVQRLTGKDSTIEMVMEPAKEVQLEKKNMYLASPLAPISNKAGNSNVLSISRGMSFKDIDWLLDMELPPIGDELYRLLAN